MGRREKGLPEGLVEGRNLPLSCHTNGKLRLMYEASPLAMVIEQAGGRASNGTQQILDIVPTSLHQRVPLLIGSAEDVAQAESFYG